MRPKLLCAISLLLNVAFVGYWLKLRESTPAPLRPPRTSPIETNRSTHGPARYWSPKPIVATTPQTPAPPPWSRIESADFPTFIANLRATGCQERTIRDIVVPEVNELFKKRSANVPEEDLFWLTADLMEKRDRSTQIARLNLEAERRELLKSLLGLEGAWPEDHKSRPEEWAGFCALLTPPTFEAAEEMAWVMDRTEFAKKRIETLAGYPLKLSEIDELKQVRNDALAEVNRLVGRPRIDEVLGLVGVALVTIKELDFLGSKDPVRRFTEDELRRLVAAAPKDLSIVDEAFDFEVVTRLDRFRAGLPKDASAELKAAFLETLPSVLGDERAAALKTRSDSTWSDVSRFVRDEKLPVKTAEMLADVHSLADTEARRIRNDPALSPEEEVAALRNMGDAVTKAVGEQLPPALLQRYLQEHGQWIYSLGDTKEAGR
jgi:hypothetical protein